MTDNNRAIESDESGGEKPTPQQGEEYDGEVEDISRWVATDD